MKKKVLFVIHQLNHGGVQKALISALNAIDYTENEVTVYVRKNRVQLLSEVNKNVTEVIVNQDKTHYYRKPYAVMCLLGLKISDLMGNEKWHDKLQKKLVKYINEAQMEYEKKHYFSNRTEYDVAVSYIQGYTAQFVAEYIEAKKKVMFFHGSVDENHELHEKIMPRYQKIVGVNEKVQEILSDLYPSCTDKMTFIENYVDASVVCEKSREYVVSPKSVDFVLCSCGRLAPVKGYDLAIEAAKKMKEKEVSFYWYLVGDGPERLILERLIDDNNLRGFVEITGMKDNPYPYIAACDIYIQPSYEEAHPLTIIEAMILGRLVVTTDTVGGQALVEDKKTGLIVERSSSALEQAISQLNDNKQLLKKIECNVKSKNFKNCYRQYYLKWNNLLKD